MKEGGWKEERKKPGLNRAGVVTENRSSSDNKDIIIFIVCSVPGTSLNTYHSFEPLEFYNDCCHFHNTCSK